MAQTDTGPPLMPVKDALHELNDHGWGMSQDQIYALIRRGDIKSVRAGRSIRVLRTEVDRLCGRTQ